MDRYVRSHMRTTVKLALALALIVLVYKLVAGGESEPAEDIDRID
ncbi:hypothetical protein GCM10009037_04270 [Halarchaeum grantii]|uniref:Uncharacterized protein n=1 Tax=Halarchaeum grantii TaxID=1193105 RepID=A0A830EYZ4_9EURY|nr:hypothetical protein GCM10009037_04270 [Halarchaeum grantii]